ncbi:hypothetical protein BDA99DRAFT_543507 [Phascolomyces articulosus]|uniref:DUF7886 domain-containing protein n=1 Tax=Phascolomyces articulosus TaxID=60185 RepID=A0AAD5JMB2_9FUNG|nr:hypothetical protein BDA99DRAFT_543507 [Phascolomyces articulosus]
MLGQDPGDLRRDQSRITGFLQECRALGSLRGFKYFEVFMRGREELVLIIPKNPENKHEKFTLMPPDVFSKSSMQEQLPQQQQPLPQTLLAECMPINPNDEELKKLRTKYTVLLITGYGRYKCPYIYNRTSDDVYPMSLESTDTWRRKDIPLWEMIKEVFIMITESCPTNPFKLDHTYLGSLPLEESVLLTGALLNFLQNLWIQAEPIKAFVDEVYEDIKLLQTRHLHVMHEYTNRNIHLNIAGTVAEDEEAVKN